jgi:hypothetical protein
VNGGEPEPLLRVTRGRPDDDELAALTAVIVLLPTAGRDSAEAARRRRWNRYAATCRLSVTFGVALRPRNWSP